MNKLSLIVLGVLSGFCASKVQAQRIDVDFHVIMEDTLTKVSSPYSYFKFIDSRLDTVNLGVVQKGAFNRKAWVKNQVPLVQQFDSVFNRVNVFNANKGDTLVFQLRNMKFAELTEAFKETGYFYLRGTLYKKEGARYNEISKIDTVAQFNAMDVTKKNFKNGTMVLLNYFKKGIALEPVNVLYTEEQLYDIDNVEKQKIPLYTAQTYKDGIYKNFESFKNLTPQYDSIKVEKNKKGKVLSVSYKGDTGKYFKADPKFFYGVIHEGKPYICTEYGIYQLTKTNDNFYYTGRVRVNANQGDVVMASALFGIIGGLVASNNSDKCVVMIDHLSGESVIDAKLND